MPVLSRLTRRVEPEPEPESPKKRKLRNVIAPAAALVVGLSVYLASRRRRGA